MEVEANFPKENKSHRLAYCKGKLNSEERDLTTSLFHNLKFDFRFYENTLTWSSSNYWCGHKIVIFNTNCFHNYVIFST
jgi:hypothetical protein